MDEASKRKTRAAAVAVPSGNREVENADSTLAPSGAGVKHPNERSDSDECDVDSVEGDPAISSVGNDVDDDEDDDEDGSDNESSDADSDTVVQAAIRGELTTAYVDSKTGKPGTDNIVSRSNSSSIGSSGVSATPNTSSVSQVERDDSTITIPARAISAQQSPNTSGHSLPVSAGSTKPDGNNSKHAFIKLLQGIRFGCQVREA